MISLDSAIDKPITSAKKSFADTDTSVSLIEEVFRLTKEIGAIDLAVGSPLGLPAKEFRLMASNFPSSVHNYGDVRGLAELRQGITKIIETRHQVPVDPERQIVITNGATEGLMASVLALIPKDSEVIVFEPFYSFYVTVIRLSGLIPRFVSLSPTNGWRFSKQELEEAFNSRTAAIIINTPHNPTGHVFGSDEINFIANLCIQHDALCISDEVYDEIYYTSSRPPSVMETPLWSERAVKISSFSKIYSIAGWRVGYVLSSPYLTSKILSAHEVITCGTANPMQAAATAAFNLPDRYYRLSRHNYRQKRDLLYSELSKLGFLGELPQGGLFLTLKLPFSVAEKEELFSQAVKIVHETKVGIIPLGAFYSQKNSEMADWWRICFARPTSQIKEAVRRISKWIKANRKEVFSN